MNLAEVFDRLRKHNCVEIVGASVLVHLVLVPYLALYAATGADETLFGQPIITRFDRGALSRVCGA